MLSFCFIPIAADVAPQSDVISNQQNKVEMKKLTVTEAAVAEAKMTKEDLMYFSQDKRRLQVAGQTPSHAQWWHWVLGTSLLVYTVGQIIVILKHT